MKNVLLYLLRSYCLSTIVITLTTLIETLFVFYCGSNFDNKTPYSSPFLAALICGILYPIYNMPVFIALYKYKLSKLELCIESICFVKIITYVNNIINFFDSHRQMWNHELVLENDHYVRAWWHNSSFIIMIGILATILLCLFYIKIKKIIVSQLNKWSKRDGSEMIRTGKIHWSYLIHSKWWTKKIVILFVGWKWFSIFASSISKR